MKARVMMVNRSSEPLPARTISGSTPCSSRRRAAELGRHRVGIKPEPIVDRFRERILDAWRRRVRVLIGIELDEPPFLRLFTRHVAFHSRDMGLNKTAQLTQTLSVRTQKLTIRGRSRQAGGAARRRSDKPSNRPSAAPQSAVKPDGGGVPVEHRPLQASAPALDGPLRHRGQQSLADSAPAEPWPHENVLEIQTRPAAERRKRAEPSAKPAGSPPTSATAASAAG